MVCNAKFQFCKSLVWRMTPPPHSTWYLALLSIWPRHLVEEEDGKHAVTEGGRVYQQRDSLTKIKCVPCVVEHDEETSAGCWLFEFYILATSKVILGHVLTCDSAHSWWLFSAFPPGNQAAGTKTQYPSQAHYLDTEPSSPCPTLLMLSTRLRSDKYQLY